VLDNAQFEHRAEGAEEALRPFVTTEGEVAFTMPALIITAART
jgi:hypothetical protein